MHWLKGCWDRFWFEPASPVNLGVCRALFYGAFFLFYLPYDFAPWGEVSPVFWFPRSYFRWLHLPLLSPEAIGWLQAAWKAALALSCIGLWTRASTAASLLLGAYLLALPHNFGKIYHFDAMVLFILGILAFSPCGDGWSVDRLRRAARRGKEMALSRPAASGEYTWPVKAAWLIMSLVFFAAGVSKLRHSGLAWITSDHMRIVLLEAQYHVTDLDPAFPSWGLWTAQSPFLTRLIALGTVVFEAGYPLALFSPAARWVLIPGAIGMLVGIRWLMGPPFYTFVICQLFWVPWDRVGSRLAKRFGGRRRLSIMYDGACGLCQRSVAVLRGLDLMRRLEMLDIMADWPAIQKRFPALSREVCLQEMHLVTADGKVVAGFDAYRVLAWALPLGWPALPFLYLPGVRALGRRVYAAIAARRHRGGCPIPPP